MIQQQRSLSIRNHVCLGIVRMGYLRKFGQSLNKCNLIIMSFYFPSLAQGTCIWQRIGKLMPNCEPDYKYDLWDYICKQFDRVTEQVTLVIHGRYVSQFSSANTEFAVVDKKTQAD